MNNSTQNSRRKQLLYSKWRRALRWEFWPMWIFYTPIALWIALLSLRHGGLTFLSVNPGFPMSGLFGEKKADALSHLKGSEELARFELIEPASVDRRVAQAQSIMQEFELDYPVVLKPDAGQRGADVAVVRDALELENYLTQVASTILLQEHVEGEEFGVFYIRNPVQERGRIFSITEKTFPKVVGDGLSSLEELLMRNPRTHYMAEYLLDLHAPRLDWVIPLDLEFKVVEIGSHCRGSVFLDANSLITDDLVQTIDRLSQRIPGFYFGRYDIRVPDKHAFVQGEGIKVLEVNGVTSESTNIYDPNHSVFTAYRIMFAQWSNAFKVGKENIQLGSSKVGFIEFLRYVMHRIT